MSVVFFNEGQDEMVRAMLGIIPTFGLAVRLFLGPNDLTAETKYVDFSWLTILGAEPVLLPARVWAGDTSGGVSSYTTPDGAAWFFGLGTSQPVIMGYCVYNPNTQHAVWGEILEEPERVPIDYGSFGLHLNFVVELCL